MWLALLLMSCGASGPQAPARPAAIPAEAVEVAVGVEDLTVGGARVGSTADLLADPVDGLHPPLIAALEGVDPVWIHVGPGTPWMVVRKLVNSSERAGAKQLWLGTDDTAWQPPRTVRSTWRPACPDGPSKVLGVDGAWTLDLHRGVDGVWAEASVRFRPVIERNGDNGRIGADDLPPACWADASCALLDDGPARAACEAAVSGEGGAESPRRVEVAGVHGCLLPIAKNPELLAAWPAELAGLLEAYGVGPEHDVMLIPEATVPFAAVAAMLDAFAARDQAPPILGQPLVEGNDGPPLCVIPIRDRAGLDTAMGRWFGASLRAAASDGGEAGGEAGDGPTDGEPASP